jgi:hypothetical protein
MDNLAPEVLRSPTDTGHSLLDGVTAHVGTRPGLRTSYILGQ